MITSATPPLVRSSIPIARVLTVYAADLPSPVAGLTPCLAKRYST
jgi:hypothetical protein